MSELLTDEELAGMRRVVDVGWTLSSDSTWRLFAHIEALTEQRDRARDWAVHLEQELNAAGGHAHANQQAIEGEA